MRAYLFATCLLVVLPVRAGAQTRSIWILKEPASVVELDASTFAVKRTVAVPANVLRAPGVLQVNPHGQLLFAPNPDDPSPDVGKNGERVWYWDGKAGAELGRESLRTEAQTGSNHRVVESSPDPYLSADGTQLYWFANEFSRLEREGVDLAVNNKFLAWSTNTAGKERRDIATFEFPECRCATGTCSETCPEAHAWIPQEGLSDYFLVSRIIPGQTGTKYLVSSLYTLENGEWQSHDVNDPIERVLDVAERGAVIVSAIPDTGCCGWENQSDDQTVLLNHGKRTVLFDEREQYKNPDYDVSFYTVNARLSPDQGAVAMTIEASAKPGGAIQLSEDGQANPAESTRIRKALIELPAVQIMSTSEAGKRIAFLAHAFLAGWLNENEVLMVENQVLVAYNVRNGTRRNSQVKVSNPSFVFVR